MKEKKRVVRNWFFFALKLFPLVSFCLAIHQNGVANGISLGNEVAGYMEAFEVPFITGFFYDAFVAMGFEPPAVVSSYVSYLIVVLFVQIMYDVIVFLPDFCRSAFERWTKV